MNKNGIVSLDMKESEWRTTVQSLLEIAAQSGEVNLAALAREVGWKPPALHNFRRKGYGEKYKVEALESKLRQRGFGDPVALAPVVTAETLQKARDPVDGIVAQLEGMIVLLKDKDNFDFETRLAIYHEGIAGVERHLLPSAEKWIEKIKAQRAGN